MQNKIVIESLIEASSNTLPDQKLIEPIEKLLTTSPEIVMELLPYYMSMQDNPQKESAILKLILRCLDQLRYNLDRGGQKANELFKQVQDMLSDLFNKNKTDKLSSLNAILYQSHLPFTLNLNEDFLKKDKDDIPDIMPKLPEFLEQIRKKHRIRSSFDLYDGFMSQMQIMPVSVQLFLISELVATTKSIPHEVAVMMLLHPNREVRLQVARLMENIHKKVFTSLDLRRLIVIRNWILADERVAIDNLIKEIRLQKIEPAPYPISKIDKVVASVFDGAGAQLILFQAKQDNHRVVGGFILKQGIGIREPWVNTKAAKGEFEQICEHNEMELKPITLAYVHKAVRHFLAEGHASGTIPSPLLLQIAEIMGVREWQAELILIPNELMEINTKVDFDLRNENEVKASFNRSGQWDRTESFFRYWFECGELAEESLEQAVQEHQRISRKGNKIEMETIAIDKIIKPVLKKWKIIIFFTYLWACSKPIKEALAKDLLILLDQLELGATPLADIPVIQNIARQTAASIIRRSHF